MDREFGRDDYDADDAGDFERDLVFFAGPFTGEGTAAAYAAIRDECSRLGLNLRRGDDNVGSGFVIRSVTALIERAEFIIFDLTYERPNVYYELGYAHGVGNEAEDILLLAAAGTRLHFDIAPLQARYYDSIDELRRIVRDGLRAMIEETRD
jgi:hypothetical protein